MDGNEVKVWVILAKCDAQKRSDCVLDSLNAATDSKLRYMSIVISIWKFILIFGRY